MSIKDIQNFQHSHDKKIQELKNRIDTYDFYQLQLLIQAIADNKNEVSQHLAIVLNAIFNKVKMQYQFDSTNFIHVKKDLSFCISNMEILTDKVKSIFDKLKELQKMSKLTEKQRNKLPKEKFAMPKERKYPVEDKAHARNAKARASQQVKKGKLSKAIEKKIDSKADKVLNKGKKKTLKAKSL